MHEPVAQRQQPAVVVEADLDRVDLRALLGRRQHVLETVLEPAHRATEPQRQERDQYVFRVDDELGAEAAADVGSHHADAMRLEPQHVTDELADLMGDL